MSEDRFETTQENLERLSQLARQHNLSSEVIDEFESMYSLVEEDFENLISDNENLNRRVEYLNEQNETYKSIIGDLKETMEGLEEGDEEEFEIDYLLDEIESLFNEYLSDIDKQTQAEFNGLYKSPIINAGTGSHRTNQDSEPDQTRYKSPEINVGSVPAAHSTNSAVDASRIPDSWDDYSLGGDLSGFEFSGEPEFDSPETYLESRDTGLGERQTEGSVSVNVSYDGASDDDLAFLNAAS